MRIGIIGAGRLGFALATALKKENYVISGIYSRSPKSVSMLNDKLGEYFENILLLTVKESDIIFLTVPDVQIKVVADEIAGNFKKPDLNGKCFVHCSGALTSDVLMPLVKSGSNTGSLHPIQTFADRENAWKGLYGIYFGYEGSTEAREYCEEIVKSFKGSMLDISSKDKVLYHAAACIISNYTVALSYAAGMVLEKTGIEGSTGVKALMPLLEKTVKNIGMHGSLQALTGPISRGDTDVIRKHLADIQKEIPQVEDLYAILSKMTARIAAEKGSISREKADEICDLFNKGGE
jgi:predicted short-subunit dehydrogenase-like oxidoreductase (DUF2520 family)